MKTLQNLIIFLLLISVSSCLDAQNFSIEQGDWHVHFDGSTKTFNYLYKGKTIFSNAFPEAKYNTNTVNELTITAASFTKVIHSSASIQDNFGTGIMHAVTFSNTDASAVTMEQRFYFYDDYPYLLTEVELAGDDQIFSNYIAPVVSQHSFQLLPSSSNNRMLQVPWDNDGFIRYECKPLTTQITSYEATSIYSDNREGLVIGSVEHETWKSAITVKASGNNTLDEIKCFSGISTDVTRDKLPHGKVKGTKVRSAKMLIGYYNDWRMGMEAYGHANTLIVPARTTWKKGTPFGWNSWAVIAEKLSYQAAVEVSDYYKEELYELGFHNEQNLVIIDLDSFWDNMSNYYVKQFANRCKKNGQIPGIYWTPFSYWGGSDGEQYIEGTTVEGSNPARQYQYKDCFVRINGQPDRMVGLGLDPTHPATKQRIAYMFQKFKDWGFEYVKLDFLNNGAVQADSYYNPEVTTAMQAYEEGCQSLVEAAGDDMFMALSIAPMFAYKCGNSRRVSCDAWGRIGDTEYVMNAVSFGWWTDQFYQYNDPDHLLLQGNTKESMGTNRARVTSGAVTGMMLFGDNFSTSYTDRGNPELSKERAITMMGNADINEVGRLGVSFKPVYGHKAKTNGAENLFMHHTNEYLYVACINYNSVIVSVSGTIPLNLLGINEESIESIKELWSGESVNLKNGEFEYKVLPSDACVYRIKKKTTAVPIVKESQSNIRITAWTADKTSIEASKPMIGYEIYNIHGQLMNTRTSTPVFSYAINTSAYNSGVYMAKCNFDDHTIGVEKFCKKD